VALFILWYFGLRKFILGA